MSARQAAYSWAYGDSRDAVESYLRESKEVGFDIVELSAGFITISIDDWVRLVKKTRNMWG